MEHHLWKCVVKATNSFRHRGHFWGSHKVLLKATASKLSSEKFFIISGSGVGIKWESRRFSFPVFRSLVNSLSFNLSLPISRTGRRSATTLRSAISGTSLESDTWERVNPAPKYIRGPENLASDPHESTTTSKNKYKLISPRKVTNWNCINHQIIF